MVKIFKGKLDAKGKRFGILVSRFNDFIGKRLLDGALDCLERHGAVNEQISVFWVPGAFEIPSVAKRIVSSKGKYDAVICLGAIIRGDTQHFDFIASEVTKGIAQVAQDSPVPVIFGVITTDTLEQAIERAGTKGGNKGFEAAMAALEMLSIYEIIR